MPTIEDLGKAVKAKYPGQYDDLADVALGQKVKAKYPGAYDDYADVPSGKEAAPLKSMAAGFGNWALKFGQEGLEGFGASVLGTVKGIRDLGYRAVLQEPPKTLFGMEGLDKAPDSFAGQAGKFVGEAAQFALPMGAVSKSTKALGLGQRVLAETAAGGALSAMQSGGDPAATAVGTAGGAAGPLIGAGYQVGKNAIVRFATRNPEEASKVANAAAEYAAAHGIPLSLGQRTGNEMLIRTEQIMPSKLGSAGPSTKFFNAQGEALAKEAQAAVNRISPADAAGAVEQGQSMASRLRTRIGAAKDFADKRYEQVRSILNNEQNKKTVVSGYTESPIVDEFGRTIQTPVIETLNTPVNLTATKQRLQPLYDELKQTMPIAQQQASPGFTALRQILEGADTLPADIADKNLGAIKALVRRAGRDYAPTRSQGLAMQAIGALSQDVDQAFAGAGGRAAEKLAQARAAVKSQHQVAELLASLPEEPGALYQRLVQSKDRGYNLLSEVKRYAPNELRDVGKTFVQGMVDRMTEGGGISRIDGVIADWRRLGPETKRLLFDNPGQVAQFDRFLQSAKYLTEMRNKSGTAHSLEALGSLQKLFSGVKNAALARVLFSPNGPQMLTNAIMAPPTSPMYRRALSAIDAALVGDAGSR